MSNSGLPVVKCIYEGRAPFAYICVLILKVIWNFKNIKCRYGNCIKTNICFTIPLTCQTALKQKQNLQHNYAQQVQEELGPRL